MNGRSTSASSSSTPGNPHGLAVTTTALPHNALRTMTPGAAINHLLSSRNRPLQGSAGPHLQGLAPSTPNGPGMLMVNGGITDGMDGFHANGPGINGSAGSISSEDSSTSSALVAGPSGLSNGKGARNENLDGSYRRGGIVQPPYRPPPGTPLKNSNQLQYLKNVMMKALTKHNMAWPFASPVDAIALCIPDYHDIITQPMDLGTIQKRLDNYWYRDAQECIADFKVMFTNCYTYNQSGEDVVKMANELEKTFLTKLALMPAEMVELPVKPTKPAKGKRGPGRPVGSGRKAAAVPAVGGPPTPVVPRATPAPPRPPQAHAAAAPAIMPNNNMIPVMPVSVAGANSVFALSNQGPFTFPTVPLPQRATTAPPPPRGPTPRPNQSQRMPTPRATPPVPVYTAPAAAPPPPSGPGRKKSTTSVVPRNPAPAQMRGPPMAIPQAPPPAHNVKVTSNARHNAPPQPRQSAPPPTPTVQKNQQQIAVKKMNRQSDAERKEEKIFSIREQMDICYGILDELNHDRHKKYAWPFAVPVDVKALKLDDYFKVIKRPMDLQTVKEKFLRGAYKAPADFCDDIRLIFFNCYRYNPEGHEVVNMAWQLQEVFELKWGKVPFPLPPTPSILREQQGCLLWPLHDAPDSPKAPASKSPTVAGGEKKKKSQPKEKATKILISSLSQQLLSLQDTVNKMQPNTVPQPAPPPESPPKPASKGRKRKSDEPEKPAKIPHIEEKKPATPVSASSKKKSPKRGAVEMEPEVVAPPAKKPRKPRTPKHTIEKMPEVAPVVPAPVINPPAAKAAKTTTSPVVSPQRKTPPQAPAAVPASPKKTGHPLPKVTNAREMTFDEKQQLSVRINSLQGEKLERVVQIIQSLEPQYADAPEEIEIDFETLNPTTLCTLEMFVNEALGLPGPAPVELRAQEPPVVPGAVVPQPEPPKPESTRAKKAKSNKYKHDSSDSSSSDSSTDSESEGEQTRKRSGGAKPLSATPTVLDQPVFGGAPKMPPVFPLTGGLGGAAEKTFGNLGKNNLKEDSGKMQQPTAAAVAAVPQLKNAESWSSFAKNAPQQTNSTSVFQDSFEQFRKQAKEKEDKQKMLKNQEMAKKQQREAEHAKRERERAGREMDMEKMHHGHHGYQPAIQPHHQHHHHHHPAQQPAHHHHRGSFEGNMFMNNPSPSGFVLSQPSPSNSMSPSSLSMSPGSAASPPEPVADNAGGGATMSQRERDRMREAERRRRQAMAGRIDLNHQHDIIASFESQMQY
ncbi:bromodomain-containing protein 3-like [Paramacrobiotus metropolitanus]|uniref:bromodomain-containing protein 3-like n=1 Tax=Paramacrobiotus metropolitanus TaxID=2943436 RepID=UPI0024457301|nr:bromodomain-containing protein 3-like [Paramacrobiotus metropolitanus]XP_055338655.1 bromodomain-containing protein 3-like [Paramacrobiotus metropolitanus]XP_055338656.1 bromodomain-containing protein 3-like [Paramacrobiotus metropolitanus]